MISDPERSFETLWKQLNGCELVSEHSFHPERKWRFDFAVPHKKIAIEIEGGVWTRGRHSRAEGYTNDCEKYNEATLLGWHVFRFTSLMWDNPDKYILPIVFFSENAPFLCIECGKFPASESENLCDCIPF